jgi:hypothetical protein
MANRRIVPQIPVGTVSFNGMPISFPGQSLQICWPAPVTIDGSPGKRPRSGRPLSWHGPCNGAAPCLSSLGPSILAFPSY